MKNKLSRQAFVGRPRLLFEGALLSAVGNAVGWTTLNSEGSAVDAPNKIAVHHKGSSLVCMPAL